MTEHTREELEELEELAQSIAQKVGPAFDAAKVGFMVSAFTFGEGGWSTYCSNANREDMVKHLRELADVLEKGEDIPPVKASTPRSA